MFLCLATILTGIGCYLWLFLARNRRSPLALMIAVIFVFCGWFAFDRGLSAIFVSPQPAARFQIEGRFYEYQKIARKTREGRCPFYTLTKDGKH